MRSARVVLILAAVLFLWNLWGYDLGAPDEPYFAEGAREMIVDGHWAVPHVNGVVTTDKPPLFFWLIAVFSLPLGKVTSLSARLPSALAGLGTVWLTLRLGRRMSGPKTGVLAGLVACTFYLLWDKARSAQIDSVLCFLILAGLSALEAYRAGDAEGRRAGLLFWLCAALATLAKGPVGLLLPLGVALVVLAVDRDLRAWRKFAPVLGPVLFLGVVGAWIAWTGWSGDDYSVWGALQQHFVNRAIHGMHHAQPFWYYAKILPVQLLPWSGIVAGAFYLAARRRDRNDRFLLVASLCVVLFFSVSTEKRDLYVLPAYPAFALLVARAVEAARGASEETAGTWRLHRRWVTLPQGLTGALFVLAGAGVVAASGRVEVIAAWIPVTLGIVLAAGGIAMLAAAVRGGVETAVASTAGAAVAIYLIMATILFPALDPLKSARPFAQAIARETAASRAAGDTVPAFGLGNLPEAFSFYSNGVYLPEISDPAKLAAHFDASRSVYAVVNRAWLDRLPPQVRNRLEIVASACLNRKDVLLVRNRVPGSAPSEAGMP